ncbi:hypothetical protein ACFQ12_04055 [Methylobacterium trifolii]
MPHTLDTTGLPPLLETIMRQWATRVGSAGLGMGEMITAEAAASTGSLKRRVTMTPALEIALARTVAASVNLAQALDRKGSNATGPRVDAFAALADLVEQLRAARPSDNTRSLGLGW